MDDYWNESKTTPSALDDFFDEESDVTWTGLSTELHAASLSRHSIQNIDDSGEVANLQENMTAKPDALSPSMGDQVKGMGRSIGEKLESWKTPSVSLMWNKSDSGPCLQCSAKNEEIIQLRERLERTYSKHCVTLSPQHVVKKLLLGLPFSLEGYKHFNDKIALLECALQVSDSNAILAVVLFMRNTLKKTLLMKELIKRPQAAQVYVNYLKGRQENIEAVSVLKMLGKMEDASLLMFTLADGHKETEERLKCLRSTNKDYFSNGNFNYEKKILEHHIALLERQKPIDAQDSTDQRSAMLLKYPRASALTGQPLMTTLFYCCMYHWESNETKATTSPLALKKLFNISDRQFLWTVIRARARVNYWPLPTELEHLLMNQGFLKTLSNLGNIAGTHRVVKDNLPLDRVINTLAGSNAPSNVLAAYIALLPSHDDRLKSAMTHKCHQAVIDTYEQKKDKTSLQRYMAEIPPGSAEYLKAESVLKTLK